MTPAEALNLLDKATSLLQLNRQDHNNIAQALQTLQALVSSQNLENEGIVTSQLEPGTEPEVDATPED